MFTHTASAQTAFTGTDWREFSYTTNGTTLVGARHVCDDSDIDNDNDGLIEICFIEGLDAMRYQMSGQGYQSTSGATLMTQGCASGGCKGYELVRDLDFNDDDSYLSTEHKVGWTTAATGGWLPVGHRSNRFSAMFEGNGYILSGLTITTDTNDLGLFGATSRTSVISNIGLLNIEVRGSVFAGGLVGRNRGTISNSYSSGRVSGRSDVGGLVGWNVGGLVNNSYSTVRVSGTTWYVGGLVANNLSGTINNSYSTGPVNGSSRVGGLVGGNGDEATINNSYSIGPVNANVDAGGLVGFNNQGAIVNSYSTGVINNRIGNLVGRNTGTISRNSGSKTVAQLQEPTTATGIYSDWSKDDWDFGTAVSYPALRTVTACGVSQQPPCGTLLAGQQVRRVFISNQASVRVNAVEGETVTINARQEDYRYHWAHVGASPLSYLSTTDSSALKFIVPSDLVGREATTAALTIILTVSTTDNSTQQTVLLVVVKVDNGDIALAPITRTGNVLSLATPDLSDDPDTAGSEQPMYQWQLCRGGDDCSDASRWLNTGGMESSYFVVAAEAQRNNRFRVIVRYRDGQGYNQEVISNPISYRAPVDFVPTFTGMAWSEFVYTDAAGIARRGAEYVCTDGDIDNDNDGLIELCHLEDLDAMRHVLDGSGYRFAADVSISTHGCGAGGCKGYELVRDLDFNDDDSYLSTAHKVAWTTAATGGWQPIGDSTNAFSAMFVGNGYTLSGLTIDRRINDLGLFGAISRTSVISSIGLLNVEARGRREVGGLVGNNLRGTISNSYSSGSVRGSHNVGGLVGYNQSGTISNSYSSGSVSGLGTHVGGLVGWNGGTGTINNSYSTSSVDGSSRVGGLVGWNGRAATINNSYSSGPVDGGHNLGGLVGLNGMTGTINNSYSTGPVGGDANNDANVGRLVGNNRGGTINNSYSSGRVTGLGDDVSGLVGRNTGTISSGSSQTAAQLQEPTTATGIYSEWTSGWDFGLPDEYPAVRYTTGTNADHPACGVLSQPRCGSLVAGQRSGVRVTGNTGTVDEGDTVRLVRSSGDVLSYEQTAGPRVLIQTTSPYRARLEVPSDSVTHGLSTQVVIVHTLSDGSTERLVLTINRDIALEPAANIDAHEGGTVTLSIEDLGSDGLSFAWQQVQGANVLAEDVVTSMNTLTFTIPNTFVGVRDRTILSFEVTVTDAVTTVTRVATVTVAKKDNGTIELLPTQGRNSRILSTPPVSLADDPDHTDYPGRIIRYQWQRFDEANSPPNWLAVGSSMQTYTVPGEISSGTQFRVQITYRDGQGYVATAASDAVRYQLFNTVPVIAIDDERIVVAEGGRVTIGARAMDSDGDALIYRWNQVSGSTILSGEINTSTNTLVFDVPTTLVAATTERAVLTYVLTVSDAHSSTTRQAVVVVLKKNHGDIEQPTLTQTGFVLSTQFDLLTDPDSTRARRGAIVRYQWQRNDGTMQLANWITIGGAHASSYLVAEDMKGQTPFRVRITYTDGQGYETAVYSTVAVYSFVKSGSKAVCADDDIDNDNDGLIELCYLDNLDAIRYVLDGSGYKASASATTETSGCASGGCKGYELVRDLDFNDDDSYLSTAHKIAWITTPGGWSPIGANDQAFSGAFDGNGYTLSNLTIYRTAGSIGLFGELSSSGTISRISLSDAVVHGNANVGGLVGQSEGTITNSDSSGRVSGGLHVGGLVGYNLGGTIGNSYSGGSVTGDGRVGGLVGYNNRGTVSNSYSSSSARCTGNSAGGLVGLNRGIVSNSYGSGSVRGGNDVGGLVGGSSEMISNSYSSGSVRGDNDVGGLVGQNSGTISNSYWDIEASGVLKSAGGTSKTTVQLQTPTTATGIYSEWTSGWDFGFPDEYPAVTYTAGADATRPACGVLSQPRCGSLLAEQRTTAVRVTGNSGTVSGGNRVQLFKPEGNVISYEQTAGPSVLPQATTSPYRLGFEAPSITQGISTQIVIVRTLAGGSTERLVLIISRDIAIHPAANINVNEGETVTFGTEDLGSADLSFEWHQIEGTQILTEATDTSMNTLSFAIPNTFVGVSDRITLRFEVIIKDVLTTVTRVVTVTVAKIDDGKIDLSSLPPTQSPGSRVLNVPFIPLTSDPDSTVDNPGRIINYQWQRLDTASSPPNWLAVGFDMQTYTVPSEISSGTQFRVQITYSDGQEHRATIASGAVHYRFNTVPVISVAEESIAAAEGERVTIDASGTMDSEGHALSYRWHQVSGDPVLSSAVDTRTNTLVFDVPITYVAATTDRAILTFTLTVSDAHSSTRKEVVVTVTKRNNGDIVLATPVQTPDSRVFAVQFDWAADIDSTAVRYGSLIDYQWLSRDGTPVSHSTSNQMTRVTAIYHVPETAAANESYRFQVRYRDGQGYATTVTSAPVAYTFVSKDWNDFVYRGDEGRTYVGAQYICTDDDIDNDDDGLIELCHLDGLDAMRHQMTGQAYQSTSGATLTTQGCASGGCRGYELVRNLDFNDDDSYLSTAHKMGWTTATTGGWQPIGDSRNRFSGMFEGNGYTLSGLTIDSSSHVGLFGFLSGTINSLGLLNVNVRGRNWVGGLVGENNGGTINNSYSTGRVTGTGTYIGGLVGENDGATINNSYSTGRVGSNSRVGGLVGYNDGGTINNSYSTGRVGSNSRVGGLVGENDGGTINNSYSTGQVSGNFEVGGLIGNDWRGRVNDSYWDTTKSGLKKSAQGRGETTTRLQSPTAATGIYRTWSEDDWDFGAAINYPALRFSTACGASQQPDCGTLLAGQRDRRISISNQASIRVNVVESETVVLDASQGDFQYRWAQVGDTPLAYLGTTDSATLRFVVPSDLVSSEAMTATLRFVLTVSADDSSTQQIVLVVVAKANNGDIVLRSITRVGNVLTLDVSDEPDGAGSTDPTYQWQLCWVGDDCSDTSRWSDTGGMESSYFVGGAEARRNNRFRVIVRYSDGQGYSKEVISNPTTYRPLVDFAQPVFTGKDWSEFVYTDETGITRRGAEYVCDDSDIDNDNDGLIELCHLDDLDAMRHTLDGSGYRFAADVTINTQGCGAGECKGYELVRDLDFFDDDSYLSTARKVAWTAATSGWQPIGDFDNRFSGIFEGNGYTLSGLTIIGKMPHVGLVSSLSGTINGVGLLNAQVSNPRSGRIGSLVGGNFSGTVSNCYSSGQASGANRVGGLIGYNQDGTIRNSYSTAQVSATRHRAGGLVGHNLRGTISNSYSTGRVSGTSNRAGGLVGENSAGTISNSYSSGRVSSSRGGLVGRRLGRVSTRYSYWDRETSGVSRSDGGGIGKTTAELQSPTAATGIYRQWTSGWDFGFSDEYPAIEHTMGNAVQYPACGTSQQPRCGSLLARQRTGVGVTDSSGTVGEGDTVRLFKSEGDVISYEQAAGPSVLPQATTSADRLHLEVPRNLVTQGLSTQVVIVRTLQSGSTERLVVTVSRDIAIHPAANIHASEGEVVTLSTGDLGSDDLSFRWHQIQGANILTEATDTDTSTLSFAIPNTFVGARDQTILKFEVTVTDALTTVTRVATVTVAKKDNGKINLASLQPTQGQDSRILSVPLISLIGDPDSTADNPGEVIRYQWQRFDELDSPPDWRAVGSNMQTYTVPSEVSSGTQYRVQITYRDGQGYVATTASRVVTYQLFNTAPLISVAEEDITAAEGETVTIARATDSDGDTLSYRWHQASGTPVLAAALSIRANALVFDVPIALVAATTEQAVLIFTVTVSDAHTSATRAVSVTVSKKNNGNIILAAPLQIPGTRVLTAQFDWTADIDNTPASHGSLTDYQWLSRDGTQVSRGTPNGMTQLTAMYHVPDTVPSNESYRLQVRYIDGQGYATTVTSAPVAYTFIGKDWNEFVYRNDEGSTFTGAQYVCADDDIDNDNDGLIEVCHLDGLDAMRYALDGSAYKASASATAKTSGCASGGCRGYELVRDLDFFDDDSYLSTTHKVGWTTTASGGWLPIGDSSYFFSGMFEGNGYTLSGLTVHTTANRVGLFAAILETSVINRIGLLDVALRGSNNVGGLVGSNFGMVNNSYSRGRVSGIDRVGGLVGWSNGAINNSYSRGEVSGSLANVGGLVGYNERVGRSNDRGGTVNNSYSIGSVRGSDFVGGLVGYNDDGVINNSYSTGEVTGLESSIATGGLVGYNDGGMVNNSYSTSQVSGDREVGGLVGLNVGTEGKINNSYSTGQVRGSFNVGGLVGDNDQGTVENSYWDVTTSEQLQSDGGTSQTTVQLQSPTSATGIYEAWTSGWDFGLPNEYPAVTHTTGTNADYLACSVLLQPRCGSLLAGQRTDIRMTGEGGTVRLITPKGDVISYEQTEGTPVLSQATTSPYGLLLSVPRDLITQGVSTQVVIVRTLQSGSTERLVLTISRDIAIRPAANINADESDTVTIRTEDLGSADLSFRWQQIQGASVLTEATDTRTNTLRFAIPTTAVEVGDQTILRFEVTIKDTLTTVTRVATVTVAKIDNGEIDISSLSPTQERGSRVLSAPLVPLTSDPDSTEDNPGDIVSYRWQRFDALNWQAVGSNMQTYTVPSEVSSGTQFRVQIAYRDGQGYAKVIISGALRYQFNTVPVISVDEENLTADEGETVTITARAVDGDGDALVYRWHQVSGDTVLSDEIDTSTNTLIFDVPTALVAATTDQAVLRFALMVSDAYSSATEQVVVTVRKQNNGTIGLALTGVFGATTLSAEITSADPDGISTTPVYQWQVCPLSAPDGCVEDSNNWVPAAGTTHTATYVVPTSSVINGDQFRVVVTYTDGQGYDEVVSKALLADTVTISSASNDRLIAKAELAVARATFTATDWQQFLGGAQAVCDDSDIDNDDDSLIEVCYLEDLDAIRYALDGSGLKSSAEASLRTEGCGSDICRGYELVRDLDFNDDGSYRNATTNKTKWTTATGWLPIGSDANRFSGIFEGNGHILSHLTIRSTRSDMALFGGLSSSGIINGMGLLYAEVHGGNHVGSLVARNGGTIINSYSSGLVSGSGSHVGGLAARNDSTISNSYSSGRVSSTGDYIGGLVGWNQRGTINNSYSSGLVSGTDTVGGLVGWNTSGTISNSYNRGPVAGGDIVGGLAGRNTNVISNSYSSAPVTGSGSDIGDLIGLNDDSATLSHSSSKTSTELQTPTAATGIYSTWSSVFWDFGTADNYPAVKHAPGTDTRYISCGTSQQPTCGSLLFWQRLFVISTATNIQIEVKEGEAVGLSVVHAAGVTYQWHQTTGVSLSLGTTDTAELRFFVPNNVVDRNTTTGLLQLKLTLSDGTSQTISLIVTKVDNTVMTTPLIVIDEVENILLVVYNRTSDLDGIATVQRYQWQICRGSAAAAVVCNVEDNWQPALRAPSSAFYVIPDSEAVAGNQFRVQLTYTDGQNNTQTVTSTVFSYQETKAIRVRIKLFLEGALQ